MTEEEQRAVLTLLQADSLRAFNDAFNQINWNQHPQLLRQILEGSDLGQRFRDRKWLGDAIALPDEQIDPAFVVLRIIVGDATACEELLQFFDQSPTHPQKPAFLLLSAANNWLAIAGMMTWIDLRPDLAANRIQNFVKRINLLNPALETLLKERPDIWEKVKPRQLSATPLTAPAAPTSPKSPASRLSRNGVQFIDKDAMTRGWFEKMHAIGARCESAEETLQRLRQIPLIKHPALTGTTLLDVLRFPGLEGNETFAERLRKTGVWGPLPSDEIDPELLILRLVLGDTSAAQALARLADKKLNRQEALLGKSFQENPNAVQMMIEWANARPPTKPSVRAPVSHPAVAQKKKVPAPMAKPEASTKTYEERRQQHKNPQNLPGNSL